MNSRSIDDILSKLSIKFNKIFCDKEFVCCVCEDLETIIKNKDKCCVLIFPTLSPNYLRVVRYQAKLLDLAVISLGSGNAKSLGVCHKKYILGNPELEENCSKKPSDHLMAESCNNTRKKRPPIQLYVPPAQRKSRQNDKSIPQKVTQQNIKERDSSVNLQKDEIKRNNLHNDQENGRKPVCFCTEDIDCIFNSRFPYFNYECNSIKMSLFKDLFFLVKLLIFNIKRMKHSYHWLNWKLDDGLLTIDQKQFETYPAYIQDFNFKYNKEDTRCIGLPKTFYHSISNNNNNSIIENTYFSLGNCFVFDLNDFEINNEPTKVCLHCFLSNKQESLQKEEFIRTISNCNTYQSVSTDVDDFILECINELNSPKMPLEQVVLQTSPQEQQKRESEVNSEYIKGPNKTEHVIILDDRKEPINKSPKVSKPIQAKKNEHEQEKEIMRKAKQNINRKTRPIIKYVEDDDTLKIGRNDNVNNWEELFDENGELEEDIFTEIVQKVGPNVTIVKAEEDYSAYASKQIEELEHMVELYDFPASLETNDLISAFSQLNSDSMYVKWVDDTHAILVLGSYTQAQKAVELSNSLIKVRPMSAASRVSLEKAHQFDLKPAMKRPQTNLQTARRLITSHLGAKSQISKEQSAKEREDLRIAKELKKQARQNEKDAWEGNLRSSIK